MFSALSTLLSTLNRSVNRGGHFFHHPTMTTPSKPLRAFKQPRSPRHFQAACGLTTAASRIGRLATAASAASAMSAYHIQP